jgi:pimeloyl-ACP methyl ester carboxylesterase
MDEMNIVVSTDGTKIAFDRLGEGPPLALVGGASVDRSSAAPLAELLAADLTVFNVDRRGRGDSGDTPPYAVEREIEDIRAVLEEAGGSANLYGSSGGAALALEATAAGLPVRKLALWEPPYILDETKRPPSDHVERLEKMIAEDRRGDAAAYFMREVVRAPAEFVAEARTQPWWAAQEALAHTLVYDARVLGDYSLPTDRAESIDAPTLVLAGGIDFPWMRDTAHALANALPQGQTQMLEGQGHAVDAAAIAPALKQFFA